MNKIGSKLIGKIAAISLLLSACTTPSAIINHEYGVNNPSPSPSYSSNPINENKTSSKLGYSSPVKKLDLNFKNHDLSIEPVKPLKDGELRDISYDPSDGLSEIDQAKKCLVIRLIMKLILLLKIMLL